MKTIRKIATMGFATFFLVVGTIFFCDLYISSFDSYTSDNLEDTGMYKVGLVLGTSKYTTQNRVNLFYKYRLQSALDLYHNGNICKILVSGDNGTYAYNEPQTFFNDLVKGGVDPKDIYLDYAGFRTYDSMIRAQKVFKLDKFLVISQQFHNERALFIARKNGIEAYAYNAKEVGYRLSPKTYFREKLARVKAILDVYILGTNPKFLGEEIVIS